MPDHQPSGSKDNSGVKGKRKQTREDRVEAVMASVVKEVVNAQKESDKLFLEVEEKRMKFEAELKREERVFVAIHLVLWPRSWPSYSQFHRFTSV